MTLGPSDSSAGSGGLPVTTPLGTTRTVSRPEMRRRTPASSGPTTTAKRVLRTAVRSYHRYSQAARTARNLARNPTAVRAARQRVRAAQSTLSSTVAGRPISGTRYSVPDQTRVASGGAVLTAVSTRRRNSAASNWLGRYPHSSSQGISTQSTFPSAPGNTPSDSSLCGATRVTSQSRAMQRSK